MAREHGVPVEAVTISDVSIKPGSKKGDGFMCLIAAIDLEATVSGQKLKKNYIAKYAPDGQRAEMLKKVEQLKILKILHSEKHAFSCLKMFSLYHLNHLCVSCKAFRFLL